MAGRDCSASLRSSSAISFYVYIPNPYVGRINVANEKTIDPQIECLYWTSTDWYIHNIQAPTDVRNFEISIILLRFIMKILYQCLYHEFAVTIVASDPINYFTILYGKI